tara:strand:+ start:179 stop:448 length:270 start_codon:yes stop_codon:yes gene_type:complete
MKSQAKPRSLEILLLSGIRTFFVGKTGPARQALRSSSIALYRHRPRQEKLAARAGVIWLSATADGPIHRLTPLPDQACVTLLISEAVAA